MNAEFEEPKIIERVANRPVYIVLCGQEPVMEKGSSVKMADLEALSPGIVERFGPNSWMQTIARAAGILDKRREVDVIIPSGKRRGEVIPGQKLAEPTEAEMMATTAQKVYGEKAPQTDERYLHSEVWLETEARNTIYNIINSANLIDKNETSPPSDAKIDKIKDSTYVIGTHYHKLRLKLLASYFGFNPSHVLSAEEVMSIQARQDYAQTLDLSNEVIDKSDTAFIKSKSTVNWLRTRIENRKVNYEGNEVGYYERKAKRAMKVRSKLIERILDEAQTKAPADKFDRETERAKLEQRLFIFEGKDIGARMREERRWVRGLVEVPDKYFIPLAKDIKSDQRLLHFLGRFDKEILTKVGLENFSAMEIGEIRKKLEAAKWDWQPVKAEWENEEYPPEVKKKLGQMGLEEKEIDDLSGAKVPELESQFPKG